MLLFSSSSCKSEKYHAAKYQDRPSTREDGISYPQDHMNRHKNQREEPSDRFFHNFEKAIRKPFHAKPFPQTVSRQNDHRFLTRTKPKHKLTQENSGPSLQLPKAEPSTAYSAHDMNVCEWWALAALKRAPTGWYFGAELPTSDRMAHYRSAR